MKNIRIIKFLLPLILISFINPLISQNNHSSLINTSNKALHFIKTKDYSSFNKLMVRYAINNSEEKIFTEFVDKTETLLKQYGLPNENSLLVETSQTTFKGKTVSLISINYPLSTSANPGVISDYQIIFVFLPEMKGDSIITFKIRDFVSPGKKIINQAKEKPHLTQFEFNTKQINWFRIWYNSGASNRKVGNNLIYALSGNSEKLKKAKINKQLNAVFKLINKAKIEKTEYKYGLQKTIGNPEYLYLRLTLKNYPYKEFKEFKIFTILSGENGVNEPNSGYIVITHSDVFKYYIKISDNPELYEKLKELAYVDHGELLEKNP